MLIKLNYVIDYFTLLNIWSPSFSSKVHSLLTDCMTGNVNTQVGWFYLQLLQNDSKPNNVTLTLIAKFTATVIKDFSSGIWYTLEAAIIHLLFSLSWKPSNCIILNMFFIFTRQNGSSLLLVLFSRLSVNS